MSSSSSRPPSRPASKAATAAADLASLDGAFDGAAPHDVPPTALNRHAITVGIAEIVGAAYAAAAAGENRAGVADACARAILGAVATATAALNPSPLPIVPRPLVSFAGSQDGDPARPEYIKLSGMGLDVSLLVDDGRPIPPDLGELRLRLRELVEQMTKLLLEFNQARVDAGVQLGLQRDG